MPHKNLNQWIGTSLTFRCYNRFEEILHVGDWAQLGRLWEQRDNQVSSYVIKQIFGMIFAYKNIDMLKEQNLTNKIKIRVR